MKKIVVIGPESTGKSTLCEKLAKYYQATWCPEYAREYLLTHGTAYSYDSLLTIAKGQVAQEEKCMERVEKAMVNGAPAFLFIDTEMYVMKVWSNFVFGKVHSWILNQINVRKYDLYLLCNVDLPWVKDELREYPDLERREKLYKIYKEIMMNQPVPWVDIKGSYEERLAVAIDAVSAL